MYLNLIAAEKRMQKMEPGPDGTSEGKIGWAHIIIRRTMSMVSTCACIVQCSSHLTNKLDFEDDRALKFREKISSGGSFEGVAEMKW